MKKTKTRLIAADHQRGASTTSLELRWPSRTRRRLVPALILLLFAAPAFAQSHADVVASVKAELEARHVDLNGPCGAFAITKRVAWQLRDDGAGLLAKPTGNQCESKAVDIIAYRDGHGFDILSDGGGSNGPTWNAVGIENGAARWMAPSDPGDAPIPQPIPAPTPASDLTPLLERIDRLEAALLELDARTHADTEHQRVWLGELQARPIVTGCTATARLMFFGNVPIHCEVK